MQHKLGNLKVALVTDWLTNLGGGEKVVKAISDIFPEAPIFTTVCNKANIGELADRDIQTSFLQNIPVLHKKHQLLLPLLPMAIESLDLSEFDLILSFSSSVAKSVITHPGQTHVCYIHSPMRYAWEPEFDARFQRVPFFLKPLVKKLLDHLREWDKASSTRPDLYIANSKTTEERVNKYYELETEVLYPPVEANNFSVSDTKKDYYLGLGRMVPYKKFDLIAEAFTLMPDKRLVLAGTGSERKKVEAIAKGHDNIEFKGELNKQELLDLYSQAKAFLLPQKEDAGIVQLEACASGTPVIAFKEGGALDVIEEETNGVFFEKQTPECLKKAVKKFETLNWDAKKIRKSVMQYDTQEFQKNYIQIIEKFLKK